MKQVLITSFMFVWMGLVPSLILAQARTDAGTSSEKMQTLDEEISTVNESRAADISQRTDLIKGQGAAKIANKDVNAARKSALNDALADLASKISMDVIGKTIQQEQETNGKVNEQFINSVQVRTNLSIVNYAVLSEKNEKGVFSLEVGVSREMLQKHYNKLVDDNVKMLNAQFQLAVQTGKTDPLSALKMLQDCRGIYDELEQEYAILAVLSNYDKALEAKYNQKPNSTEIDKAILETGKNITQNLDDITKGIISVIPADFLKYEIRVFPYEWTNTGFVSDFGMDFSVLMDGRIKESQNPLAVSEAQILMVRGHLIPAIDGLYLQTQLVNSLGKSLMTNTTWLSPATCDKIGWDKIKPKDLEKKLADKEILLKQIANSNQLQAGIKTVEFGDNPAVYYYGEEPHLLVRANRDCYITLLYLEADGTRTVLFQNYHLTNAMANDWVGVPIQLVTVEPSGVEQLLMQASTEIMPEIPVKNVPLGGNLYKMVAVKGLEQSVALTRGMAIKKPDAAISEQVYEWTVLAK